MKAKIKIFLVDDDAIFLKLLEIQFLEHGDFEIETYATGELCVENLKNKPDIIILDYLLDGVERDVMNGIETLDKIKLYNAEIPVVMLSAQDKIDVAINCMHHAAFDYVVKSETAFMRLQKIITTIFETKKLKKQLNWYMERM
ncbi:MAG: response regulator [Paludibacter sp.]|nr:response regulator [Paludibacter sp.]